MMFSSWGTRVAAASLLLTGPAVPATAQELLTTNGTGANEYYGRAVAGVGDIDHDGFADFIAGATGTGVGTARVSSGKDGATLFSFNGDLPGDFLGTSVAGAGDVDNDGFVDVIAGAVGADVFGSDSGLARVYSGKLGTILWTVHGDAAKYALGSSVAGAGDVDADGYADFMAGAPGYSGSAKGCGLARVYSGKNAKILFADYGNNLFEALGSSLSRAGDIDGDGFADFAIGANGDDGNGTGSGCVRVHSGKTGTVLYSFSGDSAGDYLGGSVSGGWDVDADGIDDVIAGAMYDDKNGTSSGSAFVFSGKTGAVLYIFSGDSAQDYFGGSVSGAGDVNGDGRADVIAGAEYDDNNGTSSGMARVLSGKDGAVLHTCNGDSAGDMAGCSVSAAGDVNLDGYADFLVGAWHDDNTAVDSGSARIHSGTCGVITAYGAGCGGSGAFVPVLGVGSCAAPGCALTVEISAGLGGSLALLFAGTQQASLPMGTGCALLVQPALGPLGPFPLGGLGPGVGSLAYTGALPIGVSPGTVTLQAFVFDPGAPLGFSNTNGVRLTIL